MKWKGRRKSTRVTDARRRSGGGRASLGGIGTLLQLAMRFLGVKGTLALVAVGIVAWQFGIIDPNTLFGGGAQTSQSDYQPTALENERLEFVKVVLADTEDIWTKEFSRIGRTYATPELVVFKNRYPTACGTGDARMGPFYCPADQTIYIDLGFYDDLERQFDAPGDFAQAYVIAHEVGHHIQTLLGISGEVAKRRGQPDYNQYSVRLELQADYLAGVWANHNQQYLDHGDIEEAMRAANQIGDDAIQSRTQGRVTPHAFTHGTSEQRMRWFRRGLQSGRIEEGDTFQQPYESL